MRRGIFSGESFLKSSKKCELLAHFLIGFFANLYPENCRNSFKNAPLALKFRASEHFSRLLRVVFQVLQAIFKCKKWLMRNQKVRRQLSFFTMLSDGLCCLRAASAL